MSEKRLNINVPEDLHFKFKLLAVKKKTTMKDLVLEYMKKAVKERRWKIEWP